jgi:hypothetical protein
VDADAHREPEPVPRLKRVVALAHRFHDPECRPHGTLGIVLVGAWPAEVDQQSVAQVLGHVALVALDLRSR